MSHAHNPTSSNMNVGNILGHRASVAQSNRFREQMRGSAVAAALTSPQRKQRAPQQAAARLELPTLPVNDAIILTHRGGQQVGGTVWQNNAYWEKRAAQKRATRQRRNPQQHQHYASGYAHSSQQSTQSAPYSGTARSYLGNESARSQVPRLALNPHAAAGRDYNPPPLKRRGRDDAPGVGAAGRGMLAEDHFDDALQSEMSQHHQGRQRTHQYQQYQPQYRPQQQASRSHRHAPESTSPNMRSASSLRMSANAQFGSDYKPGTYNSHHRQRSHPRTNSYGHGGQKTSRVF